MNKLKGTTCYLIGPMDRVPDGGKGWRNEITPFLHSRGVGILNPALKPTYEAFEDEGTRNKVHKLKREEKYGEVKEIMREIAGYDLRMVEISHFLPLYIDMDYHMCGSYHEMANGIQQKKPIITICKQGVSSIPNWLFGVLDIETMFGSIGEACSYLDKIDRGIIVPSSKRWKFFDFSKIFGAPA